MTGPLLGENVVDLSTGIAGAYCTKVLADGGADVVKVEAPGGDLLRRFSASGATIPPDDDGALFQYLAGGKRSVVADPASTVDRTLVADLVRAADGVVWSPGSPLAEHPELSPDALRRLAPQATVVAVTSFGLHTPWSDRPATEATLQAMCGSAGQRGTIETPPLIVGGRLGDYEAGMLAAVSYLISRHRRVRRGRGATNEPGQLGGPGELVDVSALEAQCLTNVMYPITFTSIAGFPMRPVRMTNLPGIHPSADGFIGFMVVTGQQWLDFCAMVERPDWAEDEALFRMTTRAERRAELVGHIDRWTGQRTSEEITDFANGLRIPVAVLGNGATLPDAAQFHEHHWYVRNPRSGFLQPDVPYTFGAGSGTSRRAPAAAPRLGEHTASVADALRASARRPHSPSPEPQPDQPEPPFDASRPGPPPGRAGHEPAETGGRPFDGLRVLDFCNNWAGPIVGHVMALFGADVIKIESTVKPDPLRFNTIKPLDSDRYWEWSPLQHGPNTSKRDLTLDMASPQGRELALRLVAQSDVIVENFSPRVMEQWGLTEEAVRAANPAAVFLRAPAYGLTGPWRDRVGYAQTIEMTAGLAWVTGLAELAPEIPNGPCDPIAGLHATTALLLALEHRRRSGDGMVLEVPMVGGALNVAAELVIEHSAYGAVLGRDGNRSPTAVPQGAYRTSDDDLPFGQGRWVIISVVDDARWAALVAALGEPTWATDPELGTAAGRRAAHDVIDEHLANWCRERSAGDVEALLLPAGIAVAKVRLPHEQTELEPLVARSFFTTLEHPVTGATVHGGFPALFSAGPDPAALHRGPPPTLGQHNHEILGGLLGLDADEIARLESAGVIGTRVGGGSTAW